MIAWRAWSGVQLLETTPGTAEDLRVRPWSAMVDRHEIRAYDFVGMRMNLPAPRCGCLEPGKRRRVNLKVRPLRQNGKPAGRWLEHTLELRMGLPCAGMTPGAVPRARQERQVVSLERSSMGLVGQHAAAVGVIACDYGR